MSVVSGDDVGGPGVGTRTAKKPHPASQRGRAEAEGERLPPCRITAGARGASASPLGFESFSILLLQKHRRVRDARGVTMERKARGAPPPPRAPQKVT